MSSIFSKSKRERLSLCASPARLNNRSHLVLVAEIAETFWAKADNSLEKIFRVQSKN